MKFNRIYLWFSLQGNKQHLFFGCLANSTLDMDSEHTSYTSSQQATASSNSSFTSKCPEGLAITFAPSYAIATSTDSISKSNTSNPKQNPLSQATAECTLTILPTAVTRAATNPCDYNANGVGAGANPRNTNEEHLIARSRAGTGVGAAGVVVGAGVALARPRGSLPHLIMSNAAGTHRSRAQQLNLTQPPPFIDDQLLPIVEQRRRLGTRTI